MWRRSNVHGFVCRLTPLHVLMFLPDLYSHRSSKNTFFCGPYLQKQPWSCNFSSMIFPDISHTCNRSTHTKKAFKMTKSGCSLKLPRVRDRIIKKRRFGIHASRFPLNKYSGVCFTYFLACVSHEGENGSTFSKKTVRQPRKQTVLLSVFTAFMLSLKILFWDGEELLFFSDGSYILKKMPVSKALNLTYDKIIQKLKPAV